MRLTTPHPFAERLLLYGAAGTGKTNACLSIASKVDGQVWVVESDYSAAWARGMALDFPECEDKVRVTIVGDWLEFIDAVEKGCAEMDPARDWVMIDSTTQSYNWVQDWTMEQLYGEDLAQMLIETRRDAKDSRDYMKQKSELLQWEIVKKQYNRLWRCVQRWGGHMVLTAEGKELSSWDRDNVERQKLYGGVGMFPAGQAQVQYVMSTNLLLTHPGKEWRMTSIKDRNRELQDGVTFDDFAMDYLVGVGGWTRARGEK